MKKVFFAIAIVAAFAACNNAATTETKVDSPAVKVDSPAVVVDSVAKVAVDSTVKVAVDSTKKAK